MDLSFVTFTPAEIEELNSPFSPKEAQAAVARGLSCALSDAGLMPGEVEVLLSTLTKVAGDSTGSKFLGFVEKVPELFIGAGALGGAYAGYLHAKIDKALEGNDDPQIVALKRRIKAYTNMAGDLRQSASVVPSGAATSALVAA